MRKIMMGLFAFVVAALTLTLASPAMATDDGTIHLQSKCENVSEWYVNSPDEGNRRPTVGEDGLLFSKTDLIHYKTSLDLKDLEHGTFNATPAPDQPSFFSVEVSGDGGKYGTLRWNTTENYWEATSQGEQHHDVDPEQLADAFPIHLSHHVFSFGVGYTANPPGTVDSKVKSVTFNEKTYDLTCQPVVTTTSPTTKPTTVKPSASKSSSHTAGVPAAAGGGTSGGALAITGSSTWPMVGFGAAALAVGGGLFLLTRKRRAKFVA